MSHHLILFENFGRDSLIPGVLSPEKKKKRGGFYFGTKHHGRQPVMSVSKTEKRHRHDRTWTVSLWETTGRTEDVSKRIFKCLNSLYILELQSKIKKKGRRATIDTLPQMHHLTLTPPPFPPHTHHPKSSLPLSSICTPWCFPEARSLRRRSLLASSLWLLWRGGRWFRLFSLDPHSRRPPLTTEPGLWYQRCRSSPPAPRHLPPLFYSGEAEGGRRRVASEKRMSQEEAREVTASACLSYSGFFPHLFGLCSCHTNEWWLFQ